MATEFPGGGIPYRVFHEGKWHILIIRPRKSGDCSIATLNQLIKKTVGVWLRVWSAAMNGRDTIEVAASPEQALGVTNNGEPFVSVFNKDYEGLSINVVSSDYGQGALDCVMALHMALVEIETAMPQLINPQGNTQSSTPPTPKRDINDIDGFLNDPATHGVDIPQSSAGTGKIANFRYFKRIAPTVIQLQEFIQGQPGKDKYQKSATEATISFHKTNPQYDEGALVYFPITGEIQIKEGNYGKQAIIPTAKGRIYVDAEYNGQEKPEWAVLSQDLGDEYSRLANDESAKLFAPNAVVVLKMSELKDKKQYKNYFHIYQELK